MDTSISLQLAVNRSADIQIDRGRPLFSTRGEILRLNNSITASHNRVPSWSRHLPINGTLEYYNNPKTNSESVTVYSWDLMRNILFAPIKIVSEYQFSLNLMEWDRTNFRTNLSDYNSLQAGVNNLTSFRGFSWLQTDCTAQTLEQVNKQSSIVSGYEEDPLPYMKTERYTGLAFDINMPILVTLSNHSTQPNLERMD